MIMRKFHILTIASVGLLIGFLLGYYVFATVHLKVYCMPSGRLLLDKNLLREIVLSLDTESCKSISFSIEKTAPSEVIFGSQPAGKVEGSTNFTEGAGPVGVGGDIPPTSDDKKNYGFSFGGGGEPEPSNSTRVISIEVFGFCSANVGPESSSLESSEFCIIKDILPYYLVLERNSTHMKTSFYENIGFNETYDISIPVTIFRVFISTAGMEGNIQSIEAYGPLREYFSLGSYTVDGDWMSLPLSINPAVPISNDWTYLNFYVTTTNYIYSIGDVWFLIA